MNSQDQERFIKKLTEQVIKLEARVKELESEQTAEPARIWSMEDLADNLHNEEKPDETNK